MFISFLLLALQIQIMTLAGDSSRQDSYRDNPDDIPRLCRSFARAFSLQLSIIFILCVIFKILLQRYENIWISHHFLVTLEEFAGFLCIKAMQGIEKNLGYDIETVLNSMFCYKLPERAPDSEPLPVSWLVVGCKGTHLFPISKIFSWRNVTLFDPQFEFGYHSSCSFSL